MEFFERQWRSYRAVVAHDLMEHRAVAAATAAAIDGWLAQRPAGAAAVMVDLGCGDLALLPPLLRRLPLASYTGLDLAEVVLPLARQALGAVPYPTHWRQGDLLSWAQATDPAASRQAGSAPSPGPCVDILHSAFAIHHLSDPEKAGFLAAARRILRPDGIFVWTDVFREPGESLESYAQRYAQRIRSGWQALSLEQRNHVIHHLSSCDIPADRADIEITAAAAGWRWHWVWNGIHRAEATAVLSPA